MELVRLDDMVRYQKKKKQKRKNAGAGSTGVSTVRGIDTAVLKPMAATAASTSAVSVPGAEKETTGTAEMTEMTEQMRWRWKGTGLLTRWFSSEWEVLGFGVDEEDDVGGGGGDGADARNYWMVTYFSKTLVTPAGIDVLSRKTEGLTEKTVKRIREALKEVQDEDVRRLEGIIFEVEMEGSS